MYTPQIVYYYLILALIQLVIKTNDNMNYCKFVSEYVLAMGTDLRQEREWFDRRQNATYRQLNDCLTFVRN